jgi:transcription elongation factor Elf1
MKFKCHTCDSKIKTTVDGHHGPTVGICGHTGATFDTLLSVLCGSTPRDIGWNVYVYLTDGTVLEGEAHSTSYGNELRLVHNDGETVLDLEDVVHIQIG